MSVDTFGIEKEFLRGLLEEVKDGRIRLPEFQRGWVWPDRNIASLIASVSLGYPVGTVMMLKTGGDARFLQRPVEGAEDSVTKPAERLILDGQQRLTSLYQALLLERPIETVDIRKKPLSGWFYISVEEALDEAEEHASKMAEALRKARARYVKTTRPNGAATAHNGDVIAKELRDYEPEDVCKLADRIFALPIGTHLAKYEHLNNGQKRMNAGNRIRGAWRKQEDKEVCDRIANLLGLNELDELDEDDGEQEQLASLEDRGPESLADLRPVEQA